MRKAWNAFGIAVGAVVAFGLLPCTSGPLLLGWFFGWPWAVGGLILCWFGAAIFQGLVSLTPWRRRDAPTPMKEGDDVS